MLSQTTEGRHLWSADLAAFLGSKALECSTIGFRWVAGPLSRSLGRV